MSESPDNSKHVFFTYKRWHRHLLDFAKRWRSLSLTAVVIFGVLWTFTEALFQFQTNTASAVNGSASLTIKGFEYQVPRGVTAYTLLVLASLGLAALAELYRYWNYVPEGFGGVSQVAAQISHLQRPQWQFRLAKVLMQERLGPLDRELADLQAGTVFVIATKLPTIDAYMKWLDAQRENMKRMLGVANEIVIQHFPNAISPTSTHSPSPQGILNAVETLARFYRETVEFERGLRSVWPSDELKALHESMYGWSDSIRDAVNQLDEILTRISNSKNKEHLSFVITFKEIKGVDEFMKQISLLDLEDVHSKY